LRLCFAHKNIEEIEEGIKRLALAVSYVRQNPDAADLSDYEPALA